MKEEDVFNDPLVVALKQLKHGIPSEQKLELLYACGAESARSELRSRQRKSRIGTVTALLLAVGMGFLLGHRFPEMEKAHSTVESPHLADVVPAATSPPSITPANANSTLAAAMSFDRIFDLLERTKEVEGLRLGALDRSPPTLSTLSSLSELEY